MTQQFPQPALLPGKTAGTHCSACGNILTAQTDVPAKGHTAATDAAVPATCTEIGYTEGSHCSVCGIVLTEQSEIPAKGHNFVGTVTTAATCETDGVKTFICSNDAIHTYTETIAAFGHDYESAITANATCTTKGVRTYTCKNDSTHTYTEDIPALGHSLEKTGAKAATCTVAGNIQYWTCSVCNKTYSDSAAATEITDTEIPALGHDYESEITTPAACTTNGVRTYTCKNDSTHTYTEDIPAIGHDYVNHDAKAATCTEAGWDAYVTCSRCDYTTYAEIPALGHILVKTEAKAATSTEEGNIAYWTCSRCGKIFAEETGTTEITGPDTVIPKTTTPTYIDNTPSVTVKKEETKSPKVFIDVPDDFWGKEAIDYVAEKGIMNGTSETTFEPNAKLTRAMMAQILYNIENKPAVTLQVVLNDVQSGMWYTDAIRWAVANGVMSGYGDGNFGPNDNITLEQVAVTLWNYAGKPAASADKLSSFSDADSVSSWAKSAMEWACSAGLINGDGSGHICPANEATRAQIAVIMKAYDEIQGK